MPGNEWHSIEFEERNEMSMKKIAIIFLRLQTCALLLVLAVTGSVGRAQTANDARRHLFHIPSQKVNSALSAYEKATGLRVQLVANIAENIRSKSVDGELPESEALARLLADTGLGYRFVNAEEVLVEQSVAEQEGVTQLGVLRVQGEGGHFDAFGADVGAGGNRDQNRSMAQRPYTTPGSTGYISREQIDRSAQSAVGDIFKNTAGVLSAGDHSSSGLNINIRGLQGMDRINMLVDGTQQSSSQYVGYHGTTSSVYIDQDFISGIDITKGPDGGQFGTGAMGGVVNMRTLDATDIVPEGKKYGLVVKGSLGSNTYTPVVGATTLRRENPGINGDAYHYSVAVGALFEPASVMLGVSRRKQGNYVSGSHFNGETSTYSTITKSQEVLNTSQDSTSETIKIKPTLVSGHSLELGYTHYYDSHGELNEYILLYPTLLTYAQGSLAYTQTHAGSIRYSFHPENSQWINLHANLWGTHVRTKHGLQSQWTGSEYNLGYPTTTVGSELFNTASPKHSRVGDLALKYGLSFSQENANGTTLILSRGTTTYPLGDPDGKRILGSAYMQAVDHIKPWISFNGGLRYDRYHGNGHGYYDSLPDQDKGRVNGSAGMTIEPWNGLQFFTTYTHGWRPPSLREAFWQFTTLLLPNANLKPETSDNVEVGFNVNRQHSFLDRDSAQFKFAYFSNHYGNYIVRNKPSGYTYYIWDNLDHAEYRGVELQGEYKLPYLFAQGAYTKYTHINYCAVGSACSGSSLSNDYYGGNYVPPSYSGSGTLGTHLFSDALNGSLSANYWARRNGIVGFTQGYIAPAAWPNSIVLNSSLSYKATRHLEVGASGENLTDRYYIDPVSVAIQAAPGRTFRLNATYRF
jgi:hemoglobin/transferrin/lactoferrin receptor protein